MLYLYIYVLLYIQPALSRCCFCQVLFEIIFFVELYILCDVILFCHYHIKFHTHEFELVCIDGISVNCIFSQHWTDIQELLHHFWSSYPITNAVLCNKVFFLSSLSVLLCG
jgi:hypothetical protein